MTASGSCGSATGRAIRRTRSPSGGRSSGSDGGRSPTPSRWQGETVADLNGRVTGALDELFADLVDGRVAVVFTHDAVVRAAVAWALRTGPGDLATSRSPTARSPPSGWSLGCAGWCGRTRTPTSRASPSSAECPGSTGGPSTGSHSRASRVSGERTAWTTSAASSDNEPTTFAPLPARACGCPRHAPGRRTACLRPGPRPRRAAYRRRRRPRDRRSRRRRPPTQAARTSGAPGPNRRPTRTSAAARTARRTRGRAAPACCCTAAPGRQRRRGARPRGRHR